MEGGAGPTDLDDDDLPVHGIRRRDILCQGDYNDTTAILRLALGSGKGDDLGCVTMTDQGRTDTRSTVQSVLFDEGEPKLTHVRPLQVQQWR